MVDQELKEKKKIRGLGLVSGGLDSLIACLIIQQQEIEVIALNIKAPFHVCEKANSNSQCGLSLFHDKLGIKVHILNMEDEFLDILSNPKFGYGKNLNPCIDCRIYVLKKAKEYANKVDADFIFTGEVLNQRPKSQHIKALKIVEEESGLKGKLLRPLSALHLEPIILEKEGLIDRSSLLGIMGRSRKPQLEIARKFGLLENYNASGGCLLTDQHFTNRMKDYIEKNQILKMKDIPILKYGRHFRYKMGKIIVGRNETENKMLLKYKNPDDLIMEAKDIMGPITIIQNDFDEDIIDFAAMVTLRYSDLIDSVGEVLYGKNYEDLNNKTKIKKAQDNILKKYIL